MDTAQLLVLKTDIAADQILGALPLNSDAAVAIADAYNQLANPAYAAWRTSISTSEVFNAIIWANLTPADAADATQLWMNRSLVCQGKQFNIQTMLTGREFIDPSKANIRAGLQDALTQIPSGPAGAMRAAGWTTLQPLLSRNVTRFERLFVTGGNGTSAVPANLVVEGPLTYQEVMAARSL